MKSNKILLVSLFLLSIISLGAVSAAKDATDVTIAAETTDTSNDVISEPAQPNWKDKCKERIKWNNTSERRKNSK